MGGSMFAADKHVPRNMIRRVQVVEVNDTGELQTITVVGLADEYFTFALHSQPFGLSGVPPVGSVGLLFAANGRLEQGILMGFQDPESRPRNQAPGTVSTYGKAGQAIEHDADGNIIIRPGTGGIVDINPPA